MSCFDGGRLFRWGSPKRKARATPNPDNTSAHGAGSPSLCASGSPLLLTVVILLLPRFAFAQEPRKISDFRGDFIQQLSWSPDGSKFLFTRIHQGKMGLWTVNA